MQVVAGAGRHAGAGVDSRVTTHSGSAAAAAEAAGGGGAAVRRVSGAAVGPYGGAGVGARSSGTVIGPAGGSRTAGVGSGSYTTGRGTTINYGGAGRTATGPGGATAGRGVGGVQVTTPGGQTATKVGTVGGVQGPGGATAVRGSFHRCCHRPARQRRGHLARRRGHRPRRRGGRGHPSRHGHGTGRADRQRRLHTSAPPSTLTARTLPLPAASAVGGAAGHYTAYRSATAVRDPGRLRSHRLPRLQLLQPRLVYGPPRRCARGRVDGRRPTGRGRPTPPSPPSAAIRRPRSSTTTAPPSSTRTTAFTTTASRSPPPRSTPTQATDIAAGRAGGQAGRQGGVAIARRLRHGAGRREGSQQHLPDRDQQGRRDPRQLLQQPHRHDGSHLRFRGKEDAARRVDRRREEGGRVRDGHGQPGESGDRRCWYTSARTARSNGRWCGWRRRRR